MTQQEAVKALRTGENLFVAYSRLTNLPFVICDEESFNDQAWIFSTEEDLKEFGRKQAGKKIPIIGMKFDKKNFPRLYGTLHTIGINSIVYHNGKEEIEVELDDVARQQDVSKLPANKRPLLNPSLQLSGIYFMQELRRPVDPSQKKGLKDLEEEVLANILKSEFLVAVSRDPKDPKKINMTALKTKDGKTVQPFFSDVMEFGRFVGNQKLLPVKLPFDKLPGAAVKDAEGYVLNPSGLNIMFDKKQFERLIELKKMQQENAQN